MAVAYPSPTGRSLSTAAQRQSRRFCIPDGIAGLLHKLQDLAHFHRLGIRHEQNVLVVHREFTCEEEVPAGAWNFTR